MNKTTQLLLIALLGFAQIAFTQSLKGTTWSGVYPGSNPPVIVELTFDVNDTMTIKNPGGSVIPIATYSLNGSMVTITDIDTSSTGCPAPGVYNYSIQNDSLTLTELSDACTDRRIFMTAVAWYRANIGLRNAYLNKVIQVYPNPFSAELRIDLDLDDMAYSYRIYDLSGMLMKSESLATGNNTIGTSELPKGMYLIEIPELAASYRLLKK